jgi:hypothetical protein
MKSENKLDGVSNFRA